MIILLLTNLQNSIAFEVSLEKYNLRRIKT